MSKLNSHENESYFFTITTYPDFICPHLFIFYFYFWLNVFFLLKPLSSDKYVHQNNILKHDIVGNMIPKNKISYLVLKPSYFLKYRETNMSVLAHHPSLP